MTPSPSPSQATLPQELVDYIIDHLHDNRKALVKCSQICRAWVDTSSFYLFRCMRTRILGAVTPESHSGMPNFFDILKYTRVAANIRELHVTRNGVPRLSIEGMHEVLAGVENLRDFFCEDIEFSSNSHTEASIEKPIPRLKLSSLHILNPTFVTSSLSEVLCCFEEIDGFFLSRHRPIIIHGTLTLAHPPPAADTSLPVRIQAVTLDACNAEGTRIALDDLDASICPATLSSLTVRNYTPFASVATRINHFLSTHTSLHDLVLHISPQRVIEMAGIGEVVEGLALAPGLSQCQQLQSIHITMPIVYHSNAVANNSAIWTSCMSLISAAAPTVTSLRIDVTSGLELLRTRKSTAASYFSQLNWDEFNRAIEHLPGLNRIELWLGERPWNIAAREVVEPRLSSKARQALQVRGKGSNASEP